MNDYEMSILAADRSRQLHAEARAARLAHSAHDHPGQPLRPFQGRGSLRMSIVHLVGRFSAVASPR